MAISGARIAAGTSHHGWPRAPKAISAPARRTRPSRPSHRRGAPTTTPSAEETVPALRTSVLLEERDHQFGHRLGGLRVRVVPGAADHRHRARPGRHGRHDRLALGPGPAKSGSAAPMMTRAGHLMWGSCVWASAGADLKVFMNSAIRPGSRSLAASAAR